jgi:hypothetical protein
MAKSLRPLPAPLAQGARRFAQWRRNRTTRRIPEELWSLAAGLGAEHGLSQTCRALGVHYYDLRKRVEASGPRGESARPAFLELLASPAMASSEHVIELESPSGAKLRIQVKGGSTLDLTGLSRLFLEQAT